MQGTNRYGEGGEKSLLRDAGSELRLLSRSGREKEREDSEWNGKQKNCLHDRIDTQK